MKITSIAIMAALLVPCLSYADDFDLLPNGTIIMDTPCLIPLNPLPREYEGDVYLNGCLGCNGGEWGFPGYPNPGDSRKERERNKRIEDLENKIDRILEAVE